MEGERRQPPGLRNAHLHVTVGAVARCVFRRVGEDVLVKDRDNGFGQEIWYFLLLFNRYVIAAGSRCQFLQKDLYGIIGRCGEIRM